MAEKRWWHRWQGICPDGILVALIPGDSPSGPDEIDKTLVVTTPTVGCFADGCETVLGYAGSWDHDPTDADVDAVVPPGYRSTDNATPDADRCEECMDGRHENCTDVEDGSCCCPPGADRHYFAEEVDGG
jgi:hypothetical protein